jgi:ribonuclease J
MRDVASVPDKQLVIICTGGQGEPGAALSRMSAGEHQYLKLKSSDSVVISSTPIPGNENSYQQVGDDLTAIGVTLFRHPTHEIDGCGPLHVSGHAARDEHAEMIRLTQPRYLMPIYGGALNRRYHQDIGLSEGLAQSAIIMAHNGDVVEFDRHHIPTIAGKVAAGSVLVDQTGNIVPELVTKDRLSLRDDGFVVVIVTLDKRTGKSVASPDVITRGVIAIRDNAELMESLRTQIRNASSTNRRVTKDIADAVRETVKTTVGEYLYATTNKTPVVISVVNIIGAHGRSNVVARPVADTCAQS